METMRDIRNRMKSVGQSLQVTSAMKLISTSKLRKARRKLDEAKPYFGAVRDAMRDIIGHSESRGGKWFDRREGKGNRRSATLVVTADKGLAGGYNHAVIRFVERNRPAGSILLPIGEVGKRYFLNENYVILEDFAAPEKEPSVYEAKEIASFAAELFVSGKIDEFSVIYTRMLSTVKLEPEELPLLPLDARRIASESAKTKSAGVYACEPDEESVFDALVPAYLKGVIYGALVESFACEQAARMAAMDAATNNAGEMIDGLRLKYNRARQAAITAEVSEIVAGAAALEG